MTSSIRTFAGAAPAGLLALGLWAGDAPAQVAPDGTPDGFSHEYTQANGVRYHYVIGGEGPAIVLLHGWPTTWYLWHKVMPELAEDYTVIAADTRGRGDTQITPGGYDVRTIAADIRALTESLDIDTHHILSHDLGGQVAFSYAQDYPERVDTLTILDVPIPDRHFGKLEDVTQDRNFWHFGLHDAEHVPEMLLTGRMDQYVTYFLDTFSYNMDAVSDEEAQVYIASQESPGRLTAGLEYYRAIERNVADTEEQIADGPLEMPVLALGAEIGVSQYLVDQMKTYASDFHGGILEECGHWIPSECPGRLLAEVKPFLEEAGDS